MSLLDTELPPGRSWVRVGDFFEVTRKPRNLDISSFPDIPFAAMEAIPKGGDFEPRYSNKTSESIASGTYFERGDILVAKITPSFENGKQALTARLPAAFGYATTEVIPLRAKTAGQDPRLLFFYLLHPDVRSFVADKMEGTTARQRVPEDVLLDLAFPEIGSDDQKTMADTLCLVQQARKAETGFLEICIRLKRAMMRDLFTRGLRSERQRPTDFGVTPDSWPLVPIGSFATRTQYGLSIRGEAEGACPILRMNCQENGKVVMRNLQFVTLDRRTLEDFRVQPGDILFNRTNSYELVGRTAIVENNIEAVFASYLVRLSVDPTRIDSRFLNHFLNWDVTQQELKKLASRAVGQANINASKLRGFAVPVPPQLDEQREIVAALDAIDKKIDLHKRKRAVLEDLFKALLHKLMTGEIRVSDLDLTVFQPPTTDRASA